MMPTETGVDLPTFLYGTAWKEDKTQRLTEMALAEGFVGIDTANQRRHYHEVGVGQALARFLAEGSVRRQDLFVQTKFTYARGQDHRIPYDVAAPFQTQVRQSFESSLAHLQTDYVDAYLLHGPETGSGLTEGDWEVWRAMEAIHQQGGARLLGVSNMRRHQVAQLLEGATVKPAFVQNRCYARKGWDARVRALCRENGIVYQGFSLLTANRKEMADPRLVRIAQRLNRTPQQVVFRFAVQVGMLPLTGTSDRAHMRQDLAISGFSLEPDDVRRIEGLSTTAGRA